MSLLVSTYSENVTMSQNSTGDNNARRILTGLNHTYSTNICQVLSFMTLVLSDDSVSYSKLDLILLSHFL